MKYKAFHSRAGYYLVIDGEQTGIDYAYMHLRAAALVDKDERVRTGQLLGYVGDTGDAHGCHLHLEMWSAPGWYSGGSRVRPAARPAGLGQALLAPGARRRQHGGSALATPARPRAFSAGAPGPAPAPRRA